MHEDLIYQIVENLIGNYLTNNKEAVASCGTSLLANFLVNQQRIADSLETLARCSTDVLDPEGPKNVIYTRPVD